MGLMYTARFNTAVTAAQDVFALTTVSPDMCVIHSIRLGQTSDPGDAQAEMLGVVIARVATVGSGGAAVTPQPHMIGAPSATATMRANDTTVAATPTILLSDAWNVQAGWLYLPTPEERIWCSSTNKIVVTITAPADSLSMRGSFTFEEILG